MFSWIHKLLGINAPPVKRLNALEAKALIDRGALLLDVRTPLERKGDKIPGSRAIPLAELADAWEKLPKDREIVCQCASGGRSQQAASFLAGKGFTTYNLAGGISAWKAAGLPVK